MAVLNDSSRSFLLVLAARLAPGTARLDDAALARFFELIERALGSRPPVMRRQFLLFLQVLRWAPVLRYGTTFPLLRHSEQDAVLRWFQDAPIALLRKGFWGTKTLVFMGYYGRPEAAASFGWTPSKDGNALLKHD